MEKTEHIWLNGELVPWDDAKIHVLSHTLHYGGGAFEGIRFYKTNKGPAIFRLKEHIDRLFYSADAIGLEIPYSQDIVTNAVIEVVRLSGLEAGYIRPLAYWGLGDLRIASKQLPPELMIACWQIGDYLPVNTVDVKVSNYIRIHPDSTIADAKLCGHYLNGILASKEIKDSKYHEVLLLDFLGNIAEGAGENFFCIKDSIIYTPKLGNILAGITRETVIEFVKSLGYELREQSLKLEQALDADEAFFTGTAVEVTAIGSINDQPIGSGKIGPITDTIREQYFAMVHGENPDFDHYLTYA